MKRNFSKRKDSFFYAYEQLYIYVKLHNTEKCFVNKMCKNLIKNVFCYICFVQISEKDIDI